MQTIAPKDEAGVRAEAARRWKIDPAIRAEFVTEPAYLAYAAAEAAGQVKIAARRTR